MKHKLVQLVTSYDINYKKNLWFVEQIHFWALVSDGLIFVTRNCFID
jgi:hypothetical protein